MRPLRPATSFRELLADPLGRYAFEERFGGWALHRELVGFVAWGRPQPSDVDAIFLALDLPHAKSIALPFDVVFDARGIEGVEARTFDHLLRGTKERVEGFAARIRRQAIVRPTGLLGAAAEGFARVLGPKHRWEVFESLSQALAWLGVEEAEAHAGALDSLVAVASAGSPLVARLRSWLAAQGGKSNLAEAARALKVSVRSLQRGLRESQTSFRKECDRVHLAEAKQLLDESELKLEAVALKLGYSCLASFNSFFRRTTGSSPSAYRAGKR
jgi:AraC-like DNA-binding protein